MILKNCLFENLSKEIIDNDYGIIIFGAGMIGTVTAPEILKDYGVDNRIKFYIDNDKNKWGTMTPGVNRMIYSPDYLNQIDIRKHILLLTISRFSEVIEQLESIDNLKNMICYIVPMMCISNFKPIDNDCTVRESVKPLIPKTIHYIWLGKNKIPKTLQYCIDSWKRFCPDYEIQRWDESNYDVSKNKYMKLAYENKMYGFVSDYARLDILYTYGGVYFDTDVELIKNLDNMLYQQAFCCVEKWQTINTGGGIGAVKGNCAIEKLLEMREHLKFVDDNNNLNMNTCGYYDTLTLNKYGYKLNGRIQKTLDMNIYTYEYFHPYDYMSGRMNITEHTYGIHHFSGGWLDENMKAANLKTSESFEKLYRIAGSKK